MPQLGSNRPLGLVHGYEPTRDAAIAFARTELWLKRASGPAGSDDGALAIPPSGYGPHPWLGAALSQLGR
jgi:hypothetical protein